MRCAVLLPCSLQAKLVLHDGCSSSSDYEECSGVMNGVFKNGLHAAMLYWIQAMQDTVNAFATEEFCNKTVAVRNLGYAVR